jgi:hypothetical protein
LTVLQLGGLVEVVLNVVSIADGAVDGEPELGDVVDVLQVSQLLPDFHQVVQNIAVTKVFSIEQLKQTFFKLYFKLLNKYMYTDIVVIVNNFDFLFTKMS